MIVLHLNCLQRLQGSKNTLGWEVIIIHNQKKKKKKKKKTDLEIDLKMLQCKKQTNKQSHINNTFFNNDDSAALEKIRTVWKEAETH